MRCAVLQPSYIPWRGYFDLIHRCDLHVFYDDVQYEYGGWRNRNRIKTASGVRWLTVPVHHKGHIREARPINRTQIAYELPWVRRHLGTIKHAYGHTPYFREFFPILEEAILRQPHFLSDLTIDLSIKLARALGINTEFARSSDIGSEGKRTERLLTILQKVGADTYLSGPAARSYLDVEQFAKRGIALEFMTYDYPEYDQLYPPYRPDVSIIDLLFMQGSQAPRLIWGEMKALA